MRRYPRAALTGYSPRTLAQSSAGNDPGFWLYRIGRPDFRSLFLPEDVDPLQERAFVRTWSGMHLFFPERRSAMHAPTLHGDGYLLIHADALFDRGQPVAPDLRPGLLCGGD